MSTVGFCLEPLDVLFFRDGKPFGAATRAGSGMAMPQTLTGALRTALLERCGFDFERLAARLRENRNNGSKELIMDSLRGCGAPEEIIDAQVRGPFLAHLDKEGKINDVFVPVPAILHQSKDEKKPTFQRLNPLRKNELPGWSEKLRPLWLRHPEPTEAAKGYLTRNGQQALLRGEVPAKEDVIRDEALFGFDHRTGIEIAPDPLSAKEGGIYGATFLALRSGYTAAAERNKDEQLAAVALYTEIVFPKEIPSECKALDGSTLPLGGEGRRVAVRMRDAWHWENCQPNGGKQKPLLILTTPGFFKERWLPEVLKDKLIAAAVPGAVAVSGWDLARNGPKPNRFAAAAGSVYFLDSLPDNLPDALSDNPEDRSQGWGCYLKGVWTDD